MKILLVEGINDAKVVEALCEKSDIKGVEKQGMLEDFLMEMVNFPDICIKLAEDCVACAVDEKCASFKKYHFSKAVIHTYLSWQNEPGDALALSIKRGKLNAQSPIAKNFLTWLTKVFEDE
jgi:hypothetical protein